MLKSHLVALLAADLKANGDTENVAIGLTVTGTDGKKYRLDAVLQDAGDMSVLRDENYVSGMTCIVADYTGPYEIFV